MQEQPTIVEQQQTDNNNNLRLDEVYLENKLPIVRREKHNIVHRVKKKRARHRVGSLGLGHFLRYQYLENKISRSVAN